MSADTAYDTGAAAGESTADTTEQHRHLHPVPDNDVPTAQNATSPAEGSTDTSVPEAVDTTEGPDGDTSSRFDVAGWLTWVRDTFRPESGQWSQRPLAPDEVLDRAKRGSQLAEAGPLRRAATAEAHVAYAVKIALRCGDYLADRPARRVVVAVLLAVALWWEPSRTVLGYALLPLAALHDLLI